MTNYQLDEEADKDKYLLFYLGKELYGVPLLGVKEVIEFREAKPVPNMVDYFDGVINLRGDIIGVMDLRRKLGIDPDETKCQLIFQTQRGTLAATVDSVQSVASIPGAAIDREPNVESKIEQKYLIGVGNYNERLITLLDFSQLLTDEQLDQVSELVG